MEASPNFKIKFGPGNSKTEHLHVKSSKRSGITIKAEVGAFKYQDKETGQFVIYIPSFDLSAYGETKSKAEKMIELAFEDFFDHLTSLSSKNLEQTLLKLGWKHERLKNKDYAKAYVDVSGELKDFAVNESVTKELITA